MRVLVVGGSGFVGGATVVALKRRGVEVSVMRAPRLPPVSPDQAHAAVESALGDHAELQQVLRVHDAVVNAAGAADASSADVGGLTAANSVLPAVLARIAFDAGVGRFVHVSSAAVQGRVPVLDETPVRKPFSAYSRSKALAEELLEKAGDPRVVIYRPPSVHGPDRRITRVLTRVAASPLSSVSAPGTGPTPQSHIDNVADAIAYLATCQDPPPPVVIHPWEGLSTEQFMEILGGRPPRMLWAWLTGKTTRVLGVAGVFIPFLAANARRLDMMWHGQAQSESWLTENGWRKPADTQDWLELARQVQTTRAKTGRD